MGEFNVGTDITIVPGVRYQEERTTIRAYRVKLNGANQNGLAGEPPRLIESNRVTPNWYPSVNIKYKVTQDIQILGAAYRSVSLPSYGEITPRIEYSLSPTAVATANPLVKPSTAWNFDFGATLANNDIGLVTVNLFYKEISDLIYTMQNYMPFLPYPVVGAPADIWDRLPGPNSGYFDTSWATANGGKTAFTSIPMNDPHKAFLRGIEISWQTHLWYLPGVLSGIVLDLNASFMSSRQIYPAFADTNEGTLFRPIHKLYYRTVAGALQDQPKATYNAILGWDYMGFSSRFSLRYQQQTLRSIDTQFKLQNSYYDNVMLFDIALKQQLIDNLSVFANATNLNGHIDNYYFVHPTYQTHPEGSLPTNKQTYGWAVQFGVNFNY
jgi:TonB-dependent receptor